MDDEVVKRKKRTPLKNDDDGDDDDHDHDHDHDDDDDDLFWMSSV